MIANPDYYADFVRLTDRLYPHCTLTEKLRAYVQHKPGAVVPFLEQLIVCLQSIDEKAKELDQALAEYHEKQDPKRD